MKEEKELEKDMEWIKDLSCEEMEDYSYHIYDEGRGIYLQDVIDYMDRVDEAYKRYNLCDSWDDEFQDVCMEYHKLVDEFWDYCSGITNEMILEYIENRM